MNTEKKHYLFSSLKLLEEWLPEKAEDLMAWFSVHPDCTGLEKSTDGLIYCLFSYPDIPDADSYNGQTETERIVLLVYDHDQVIADCSALHASVSSLCTDPETIHRLRSESPWMDLEYYTLHETFFANPTASMDGEALLYANVYVTASWRRKGIFTEMLQMMRDHTLRQTCGNTLLYAVLSLDPDVACYGPDASDIPYIYTMEQDEPKRRVNAEIMKKLGWVPVRLEETDPSPEDDGTKCWFALRKEKDIIIETENAFQA